jgi:hypothetical protein
VGNVWGLQSCRWTAQSSPAKAPEGWHDAIEVAVFDPIRTAWARGQADGSPVDGLGKGALYNASYGDLWFECGNDRFCAVKVRTAASANRERNAKHLAQVVQSRLK